ncbi:unnamed protein product [Closterium sp. Naga37s-1]|nr:unnamed protein product [Closterium sp. Naga37s-1]
MNLALIKLRHFPCFYLAACSIQGSLAADSEQQLVNSQVTESATNANALISSPDEGTAKSGDAAEVTPADALPVSTAVSIGGVVVPFNERRCVNLKPAKGSRAGGNSLWQTVKVWWEQVERNINPRKAGAGGSGNTRVPGTCKEVKFFTRHDCKGAAVKNVAKTRRGNALLNMMFGRSKPRNWELF